MRYIRGFPSTMMDEIPLNTTMVIEHAAKNFGEQEVVSRNLDGSSHRYTYKDAYARIQKLACALEALGVEPGERVGVISWNTHRFFELYFGIPGIGAVLLQMNLRLHPTELVYVGKHSRPRVIFVDASLLPLAEAIAPHIPAERYVIMADGDMPKANLPNALSYEGLLDAQPASYDFPLIDEKSSYSACYTSGTTGNPKGVYYSHRSIVLHTMAVCFATGLKPDDAFFQIVPMFHAQGWGAFFAAAMAGAKLVLPGRYTLEDPTPLIELMQHEQVTLAAGAPAIFVPMWHALEKMEPRPSFSMRALCGATEPPLAMIRGLNEFGIEIVHAYGASETTPLVSINVIKPNLKATLSEDEQLDLKRSQGVPFFSVDIKLADENENEVPEDGRSVGELLVRGPWVTQGYYNDPRTFDGFLGEAYTRYWRSGDGAVIDKNRYIKIVDRFKDVIKSGGEWISSVDLENHLMAHPKVKEACVVGIPHPKWEERPLALVVPKPEFKEAVSKEELLEHLANRFAKWQLPDEIVIVEELPKTSVGKLAKRAARDAYKRHYTER